MIEPCERPQAYQKLGAAILKSAIADWKNLEAPPADRDQAEQFLFGTGYFQEEHRNWTFDLIGCDKPAMRKRIQRLRA